MTDAAEIRSPIRIIHELPDRIRVRNAVFYDPSFDPVYLAAVLENIVGVTDARFNLKTGSVVVKYDGGRRNRDEILKCLRQIPAEACQLVGLPDAAPDPVGAVSKCLLAMLMTGSPRAIQALSAYGMALPVLAQGVETLFGKGVKVQVLDASAVGFALLRKDYHTANSIVALLAVGEYLEQISENKTTGLLRNLLRPQVETVWVETDGREVRRNPDDVKIGDVVICGSGEIIPVDGAVLTGEASVNQSSITGESVPVHVMPESQVFSGSVIQEGRLRISALKVGNETGMARINRFLENSLRFKSETQKRSDVLADRLAPLTFGLGMGVYLITRNMRRAAAVLSVDYACALKLATPVAVKTAIYAAAHCGVLLKGAQALDTLARVDTVVFDKTGTLTRGVLEVTDIIPVNGLSSAELLAMAAGAEEHYTHPIARAVVETAKKRGIRLPLAGQVDFIVAHGVSAYVDDRHVLVGSCHFIEEDEGIDCAAVSAQARIIRKQGKSLLYVARDNVLEGIIAFRDALRVEADNTLVLLKRMGVKKIIMLTGDHRDTAKAVAADLKELDDVRWELKPEDKAAIVKELRNDGCFVAFAGDGVNDAPAMVASNIGICMPGGADLARESAQAVLLHDDLSVLVTARQIAVRSEKIIKNSFIASVGMNTLFLLLAGAGALPPIWSAVLHNANTIGIVGYAALAGVHKPSGQPKPKTL